MNSNKRANYLTVSQYFNLRQVCRVVVLSFGHNIYLVGSVLEHKDWRDVDIRCMLWEPEYNKLIGENKVSLRFLNVAISEWISARTQLPIDFQFQKAEEANKEFHGTRHALSVMEEELR
jgi:hypothetical protein